MNLRPLLDTALDAAHEAGRATLAYFQTAAYEVETKDDLSPVTVADREAEARIVAMIERRHPTHAILGEESGARAGSDPIEWIVDPIDGTKSFISGVPIYGVMIGVVVEGVPSVGVVHLPALGETYWAARGAGAFWNGRRARVSECASVEEARLLSTDARRLANDPAKSRPYAELERRAKFVRTWGDCYGHMLVATGRAEIMLDPKMSIWDCAALLPIVEEAGGHFTDWRGDARIDGGDAVSVNAALHAEVMRVISGE